MPRRSCRSAAAQETPSAAAQETPSAAAQETHSAAAQKTLSAAAQETPPLRAEIHPWGKFEPGAWKRIRVITETFSEQETVASTNITDSKTTLFDLDDDSLTLETKACIETAGKRFDSDPQMVKQGFHGEVLSPNLKVKASVAGQVEIDDEKNPLPSAETRIG